MIVEFESGDLDRRKGQHSVRLNDQWRLIVAFRRRPPSKTIVIIEITDYH